MTPPAKTPRWELLLGALVVLSILIEAKIEVLHLPNNHIDGIFQTHNGLARLAMGEKPGVDFFLYLGLGPYLLLFPFFLLLGGDLAASIVSAKLAAALVPLAVSAVILGGAGVRGRWFRLGCILFTFFVFLLDVDVFKPGSSLRILRDLPSYGPALLALALGTTPLRGALALGFSMSLLSLFSPASSAAMLATHGAFLLLAPARGPGPRLARLAAAGAGATAGAVLLWLLQGDGLVGNLEYMLLDVGGNQRWFFVPYVDHELELLKRAPMHLAAFAAVLALAVRRGTDRALLVPLVAGSLLATGVVSSVGGHYSDTYFQSFTVFSVSAVALLGFLLLLEKKRVPGWVAGLEPSKVRKWSVVLAGFLLVFFAVRYAHKKTEAQGDGSLVFVRELGGHLGRENLPAVEYARAHRHLTFVEEYHGVPTAVLGRAPLTNVDATIHALGSKRADYGDVLARVRPDVVTSLNPEHRVLGRWAWWHMAQNWYFYRNLLLNYDADLVTHSLIFWRRRETPRNAPGEVPCAVGPGGRGIVINGGKRAFYEVALRYRLEGGSLLLADVNLPSVESDRISLPPRRTSFEFPVNGRGEVAFETVPERSEASLAILSCGARDFTGAHGASPFGGTSPPGSS